MGVLEEVHDHVAFVAGHLPLGTRRGVQHQHPVLTLNALPDSKHAQGMLARGVGALVTAHSWWRKSETIAQGTLWIATRTTQFGGGETQNAKTA